MPAVFSDALMAMSAAMPQSSQVFPPPLSWWRNSASMFGGRPRNAMNDSSAGRLPPDVLKDMHRRLAAALPVDAIKICPHTSAQNCRCRKPLPGLLLEAAREFNIDLAGSYMIGDRAGDIVAGHAAGCRSIFVDLGYTAETPPRQPDAVVRSLQGAVDWILRDVAGP